MKKSPLLVALIVLITLSLVLSCSPKPTPTPIPPKATAAPTAAPAKPAPTTAAVPAVAPTAAPAKPAVLPTAAPTAVPSKPAPAPASKPIEFKFNNAWPATHHLAVKVFDPWAKLVEEKTQGRVKILNYHGGSLGKATENWEGTIAGMYDYSVWVPSYKYEKFLITLLGELPFTFPDNVVGTKVMKEMFQKYAYKEYSEVKLATPFVTDLYPLWSTKRVARVEDVKGMKIRIAGRGWQPLLSALGATAVSVDPSEMYLALQRKTVDGVIYSLLGGWGYKLQEVTPYVTRLDAQLVVAGIIMNKESWNKLPKDLQEQFDKELHPAMEALFIKDYVDGQDETWNGLKAQGKEVIIPAPDVMERIRATAMPVWNEWIKTAKNQGLPADEIMAYFKDLLKQNGIVIR